VPHESMEAMSGWPGALAGRVSDWKTPSAMVERPGERLVGGLEGEWWVGVVVQMLPRHTKRTETGAGEVEALILAGREV
jgi:hypothetical protein